jgi:hypothetical protein
MRARLRIGRRAQTRGDLDAARAAYRHVIARWGHAALESAEVRAARAGLAALP